MTKILAVLVVTLLAVTAGAAGPTPVELHWLDGAAPVAAQGTSFGVPWPRGEVKRETSLTATDGSGKGVPLQTWPLAYWPDGSLKWTGHAIPPTAAGRITVSAGQAVAPASPLEVTQDDEAVMIVNGEVTYRLSKHGSALIDSIMVHGTSVATNGRLVCTLEDRSEYDTQRTVREMDFTGEIGRVTLEQSGPVRAVVKLEGKHKSPSRTWLPFVVRLYFTAGVDSVRMVHTIVFDGDAERDYIRALGVRFSVPLRDEAHNRHVRFAGDAGVFAEPLRLIAGRRNPKPELYARQIAGRPLPPVDQLPNPELVKQMAVWSDYKLTQSTADGFVVRKRTNPKSAWIDAMSGHRARGLAFVGDSHGGLAVSLESFWQSCPTGLEVANAASESAELTCYLWSPDVPAMDMRHYDTEAHGLEASYEDVEPGFSTATGVARTHVLTFTPFAGVPSDQTLVDLARPAGRLVCSPGYYHSIPVFGVWSLPDRSVPAKAHLETQLDHAISFYEQEVEQRHWYGFWDFGDVMHTYDPARHEWKYDVGGYAWANTELMPDLWLWYSFLRSGRADVFRMAEAMTRHTQEVDVYHLGRFAGLGSRHNVRHWGDGAKELRISQAFLKRFYYYLTTDERTGDLIAEVYDADRQLADVDPLRKIEPKSQYPTHIRIGPDWLAAYGNWMTAYERTLDRKYLDKTLVGMRCIATFPHRFFSGDSCGYDPATGELFLLHPDQVTIPHLAALMGGPEVCMTFNPVVDFPAWNDAWLNYCRYLQAPRDEQRKALGGTVTNARGPHFARMTGFAARALRDPALASRAWQSFFGQDRMPATDHFASHRVDGPEVPAPIDEITGVSTNDTAQWSLNAIELLELVGDSIPAMDTQEHD